MKRILMAIMAVAVAVTFSAPSFAGDEKKGAKVLVYGDEKKDEKKKDEKKEEKKKDEKKGGYGDEQGK